MACPSMHTRGCVAFMYVYALHFPQRKDYAKAATAFPHELSFVQLQAGVPGQGVGAEDKAGIEGVAGVAKDITEGLMVHEGLALKGASYTAALLEACHNLGDITWQIQVWKRRSLFGVPVPCAGGLAGGRACWCGAGHGEYVASGVER